MRAQFTRKWWVTDYGITHGATATDMAIRQVVYTPAGQDPALVYVGEEAAPPEPAAEDGLTSRITLRLPESLKTSLEADAAREGISVNSLIVRALSRGAGGRVQRSGKRLRGFGQS